MIRTALVGLTVCAVAGCAVFETSRQTELRRHQLLLEEQARTVKVDPSDGISEVEAYKIGLDRLASYRTDGGVTFPEDRGDCWLLHTAIGYAGIAREDILIRKSDGTTTITVAKIKDAASHSPEPTREAVH
ncbi:MAG TPA: hypothetical protein VGM64_20355 [Lacunisphaera sp.]|jgi:hypothetical protein